jgi:hypothetical protein
MSAHDHADPSDRARIAEEDRFLAGLVGEYAAAAAASPPCARPPRPRSRVRRWRHRQAARRPCPLRSVRGRRPIALSSSLSAPSREGAAACPTCGLCQGAAHPSPRRRRQPNNPRPSRRTRVRNRRGESGRACLRDPTHRARRHAKRRAITRSRRLRPQHQPAAMSSQLFVADQQSATPAGRTTACEISSRQKSAPHSCTNGCFHGTL